MESKPSVRKVIVPRCGTAGRVHPLGDVAMFVVQRSDNGCRAFFADEPDAVAFMLRCPSICLLGWETDAGIEWLGTY